MATQAKGRSRKPVARNSRAVRSKAAKQPAFLAKIDPLLAGAATFAASEPLRDLAALQSGALLGGAATGMSPRSTGSGITPLGTGSGIPPLGARSGAAPRGSTGSGIPPLGAGGLITPLTVGKLPAGLFKVAQSLSPQAAERLIRDDLVPVLIDAPDAAAAAKAIEQAGGRARILSGSKLSARIPRSKLASVAAADAVRYVGASVRARPACDLAHQKANLVAAGTGRRLVSQTGKGVLIGVVDTGIDAAHPAFMAGRRSRIIDYLDQTTGRRHAGNPTIDIAAASAGSPDADGHGTHVAGTAAGGGGGSAKNRYQGVAPDADLAIVKTTFDTTDIGEAVAHIFELAGRRDQACVINLSLGSHYGPHDGSTPLERLIDNLCDDRGRVVVAAAGNEGDARSHAQGLLPVGSPSPARWVADFEIQPQAVGITLLGSTWLQVWTQREDDVTVALRSPHGEMFVAPAGGLQRVDRGEIKVEAMHQNWSYTGDNSHTFSIQCAAERRLLEGWSIVVTENRGAGGASGVRLGAVHAWCEDGTAHFNSNARRSHLVGMPGTAFSAVTVGAFTTRAEWDSRDPARRRVSLNALKPDDIAYFSSPGPSRDGVNKPEVSAPGQYTISALSSAANLPAWMLMPNEPYCVMQGTSMAAPYVTGAIALLLQKDPSLTWAEIKRRLIKSVAQDKYTQPCWNERWGYGKIDVERLLS